MLDPATHEPEPAGFAHWHLRAAACLATEDIEPKLLRGVGWYGIGNEDDDDDDLDDDDEGDDDDDDDDDDDEDDDDDDDDNDEDGVLA